MIKLLSILCCFSLAASELKIYEDLQFTQLEQTTDQREIAVFLNAVGIRFEQWEASQPLTSASTEGDIREAYRKDIEKIQRESGFQTVDILRMAPDHPKKVELRNKFLKEHTHEEDEVRFFVEGSGNFFLHVEGKVYSVVCEKGDLISIPPYYKHWFDMGTDPYFTAIRFFTRTEGWIPHFTGDPIAEQFVQ